LDGTTPCHLDHVLTTAATDTYAKKLLNTIPAIQETDKKKFAKTPVHQTCQQSTFILDNTQFPPLNNTHKVPAKDDTAATQQTNTPIPTTQTTNTNNKQPKPPVDLKAIQEELKRSPQLDLMALIDKAIKPVQEDMNASMAKLDSRYDELSHTVQLLNQNFQHLVKEIQKVMPSLKLMGDGRA